MLGKCDNVSQIGPVGDIAFEKVNIFGSLVCFVDERFSLWRKSDVCDDDTVMLGCGQLSKCKTYACTAISFVARYSWFACRHLSPLL